MASIRLHADPNTPHGKMIAETVQALWTAQTNIDRLVGMMGMAVRTATPPLVDTDYQPLAIELNMPFATAADIQAVKDLFYLVAVAQGKVEDPVLTDFVKRCDQGG